jgi:ABC-type amino acid transport substrate-binding protein
LRVSAETPDKSLIIRVGAYENYPKVFTNSDGNIAGIFPDILNHIASKEGWKLEYIHGTWAECLERLDRNKIDIMPDVAFSEERSKKYDFTNEPELINWGIVYTQKDSNILSIPDLHRKTIAVMKGGIHYTGAEGIKKLTKEFDIYPTFIEVDSNEEVFELLDNKEVDTGVVNRIFGTLVEKDYEIVKTLIYFNPIVLGVTRLIAASSKTDFSNKLVQLLL